MTVLEPLDQIEQKLRKVADKKAELIKSLQTASPSERANINAELIRLKIDEFILMQKYRAGVRLIGR